MWPPTPPAAPPTRPPRPDGLVSEGVVAVLMALFVTFRLITPARPPLAKPAPNPAPPRPPPPLALTWVELLLRPPPTWWLEKFLKPPMPLAAIMASASILPPVWPTLTPRLAMNESIFCDTFKKPIAHMNQIRTLPETASLPTASTWACTSSSEMAKAGWQNRQDRAATISARNKIILNLFKAPLLTKRADWQ